MKKFFYQVTHFFDRTDKQSRSNKQREKEVYSAVRKTVTEYKSTFKKLEDE